MRSETPEALFQICRFGTPGHIGREFSQGQIEVATEPHCKTNDSSHELRQLRQTQRRPPLSMARRIGVRNAPLASWRKSVQSPKARYAKAMDDLQMIGQRNMLRGMYVPVELLDRARRVDIDDADAAQSPALYRLGDVITVLRGPCDRDETAIVLPPMTNYLAPAYQNCFIPVRNMKR